MTAIAEQLPDLGPEALATLEKLAQGDLPVSQQLGILWRTVEVLFDHLMKTDEKLKQLHLIDEELERVKDWKTRNHDRILHLWMLRPGGPGTTKLSDHQLEDLVEQLQPYLVAESPCPLLRPRLQQIHS